MAVFRTDRSNKFHNRILPIFLSVIVCAAITGLIVLFASFVGRSKEPQNNPLSPSTQSSLSGDVSELNPDNNNFDTPNNSVTFSYRDRVLTALPGVAVNEYSIDDFSEQDGRLVYHGNASTLVGVDVSSHQETIHWPSVKADGIDFAMIRVGYRGYTEGGLFLDNNYHENIVNADKAGLQIGVYFFSQAVSVKEAVEEADQLLAWLDPYKDLIDLPVVFDWEFIGSDDARTKDMTGDMLNRIANAFCAKIKDAGFESMIYFNRDLAYLTYDLSVIDEYPFWLAEYDGAPTFYYHFDMLQYTANGKVNGIDGDVDLNLYFLND